jgi:iron(III) transport system ATP-binding protein
LGITTLYVTHDQEEALTLSDRIAVFNKGMIEQVGSPDEIYNHSATEFVCDFIGDINRLSPDLVEKAAGGAKVDNKKKGFIRVERLSVEKAARCNAAFSGTVSDREYYGLYTKYTFKVENEYLKCIEKNNGAPLLDIGEKRDLHFNFDDIMLI